MNNYFVEEYIRKVIYNACSTKFLKGHTPSVKCLYIMKEIDQGCRIVTTRRSRNNESEAKYKMLRALKNKISRNQHNKKTKFCEKFGIKVPNSTR